MLGTRHRRMTARAAHLRGDAAGFAYLALLFFVVVMGVGLAAASQVWHTLAQREKELELLFVGRQFELAIQRYYDSSPAAAKQYPKSLEDLLIDARWPSIKRHLRRIYPDPMTGQSDWVLIKRGDRIIGLHSRSAAEPFKVAGFDPAHATFAGAIAYSEWTFVAQPGVTSSVQASAAPPTGGVVKPIAGASIPPPTPAFVDPRLANPDFCTELAEQDASMCRQMGIELGFTAGAGCRTAAAVRASECAKGQPLTELAWPALAEKN